MFEFRASYLERGYHKPGDPPFEFPPRGTESTTDSNLIEIRGRNGSGKTTLLNILALALGFLDREQELHRKPILKSKLRALDQNESLEYNFHISRQEPFPIDLKLQRLKGQKPRAFLNSKAVGIEAIVKQFDVVFLTEDDPAKVISASLGKLSHYFGNLDARLNMIQEALTKYAIENSDFKDFKQRESTMSGEIENQRKNIVVNGQGLDSLGEKLKKVELRDSIKAKLELLNNRDKIEREFAELQEKHDQLSGKKDTDILDKIYKETIKLARDDGSLKENSVKIIQTCDSLSQYGVHLSSDRLLQDDHTEYNNTKSGLQGQSRTDASRTEMVEDIIKLLERYPPDSIVPVFEKTVRDVLMDFYKVKARQSSDRVRALIDTIGRYLVERREILLRQGKLQGRIDQLSQNRRDLERIDKIARDFVEAEKKYIGLQTVLQEDRKSILSSWAEVNFVEGSSETLRAEMQRTEAHTRAEESLMGRTQQKLALLRENASKKPKYFEQDKELRSSRELVSGLREKLYHWGRILINPAVSREQFESIKGQPGFSLDDYEKFLEAVGQFLGDQFEPVFFDNRLHGVKFLDLERNSFTTDDDRLIPIQNLSQGQSKITTITGSFKQMGQEKSKIVLVDEIADLDPENLRNVKRILTQKFNDGSLLLAVLVRPTRESSESTVEIVGWD